MSYILDALQRDDRERNLGEVPGPNMAVQGGAAPERHSWLPAALSVVLLSGPIATGLWLFDNGYLRIGSPASPAEVPASEAALPPAAKAEEAVAEPVAAEHEPVIAKPEPVSEPAPQTRSPRIPTPSVAPTPNWVRGEEVGRFRQEHASTEPVRNYLGLPESLRSSLPKLDMNALAFSTNPARSFVLINGKRYRIGDYLAEGPEVADILPGGAVLNYRGETFLLPAAR